MNKDIDQEDSQSQKVSRSEILKSFDDDEKIIAYAKNSFETFANSYRQNYQKGQRNREFLTTDEGPWQGAEFSERSSKGRSKLNVNVLTVRQRAIQTEYFANNPIPEFTSLSGSTSTDNIEAKQNMYNYIYHHDGGKYSAECMYQNSTIAGWGAYWLSIKPSKENPFVNVIYAKPVKDVFTSFFDPLAIDKHKIHGMMTGQIEIWPFDVFKANFPDQDPAKAAFPIPFIEWSSSGTGSTSTTLSTSILGEGNSFAIPLCRFNYKIPYKVNMIEFSINGKIDCLSEEKFEEVLMASMEFGFDVKKLRSKEIIDYKTRIALISNRAILESVELPWGELLQLYCPGSVDTIDGCKEITVPYTYCALSGQVLLNMGVSELTDSLNRSFGSRIVGSHRAIGDRKEEYANPKNLSVLFFNDVGEDGQTVPNSKPDLIIAPSFDPNILNLITESLKLIEVCIGQSSYDLAHSPVEASGFALLQKQIHGNLSLGVYPSNANATLTEAANLFLKLVPHVYDTERDVMITTRAGKTSKIRINEVLLEKDYLRNDMQKLDTSVVASTMMSGLSQDLSFLRFAFDLMQVDPQNLAHVFLDIISDSGAKIYPSSHQISERLKLSGYIDKNLVKDEELKKEVEKNPGDFEKIKQGQQEQADHERKIKELEMAIKVGSVLMEQKNNKENMELQKLKILSDIMKNIKSANNDEKETLMNTLLSAMKIESQRESNLSNNIVALSKEIAALSAIEPDSEATAVAEKAIKSTTKSIEKTV